MWCDTLIKINRDQREHSMNLKCIKMNLLSLRGVADRGFYFLCSNLDLKANTSNCKWQLLKLTSLQFISLFIFRFYNSDRARSARTSGRNFCSLSDWETAASSKVGNSGLHVADCKPCGTVPSACPQPMNKSSLHLLKGKQIASYSWKILWWTGHPHGGHTKQHLSSLHVHNLLFLPSLNSKLQPYRKRLECTHRHDCRLNKKKNSTRNFSLCSIADLNGVVNILFTYHIFIIYLLLI